MKTLKLKTDIASSICLTEGLDEQLFLNIHNDSIELDDDQADFILESVHGHCFEVVEPVEAKPKKVKIKKEVVEAESIEADQV